MHKRLENLLYCTKKKKKVRIGSVQSQNSILVGIILAQRKVTHTKEDTGFSQLHNQAFCQLCRTLGRLHSMRRCQRHNEVPAKEKKKKRMRKENDVVPLLVVILVGSKNACSSRALSTFSCVASADRACAVILEPLVNAAGVKFVPTRKHTQDLSGLKVAHAYHT